MATDHPGPAKPSRRRHPHRAARIEVIDLLAAKAPSLDRAPAKIVRRGGEVVLIDGIPNTAAPVQRTGAP